MRRHSASSWRSFTIQDARLATISWPGFTRLNPSVKSKHLAEQCYQKAHQLEPGEMDFILDLAEFYANHGLYARCRTYLDKAQAIELRNPRAIGLRKAIKGKG